MISGFATNKFKYIDCDTSNIINVQIDPFNSIIFTYSNYTCKKIHPSSILLSKSLEHKHTQQIKKKLNRSDVAQLYDEVSNNNLLGSINDNSFSLPEFS